MFTFKPRPPALTELRGFCERNAVKLLAVGFVLSGIGRVLARFNGDLLLSHASDALFLLMLIASVAGFIQRFRRRRSGKPAPTTGHGKSRDDLLFTMLKQTGLWVVWLILAIPVMFLWAFMSNQHGLTLYILSGGVYGAFTVAGIRAILAGRYNGDLLSHTYVGLIVTGFVIASTAILYGWIMFGNVASLASYYGDLDSTQVKFALICRQMSISGVTGIIFAFMPLKWRGDDVSGS